MAARPDYFRKPVPVIVAVNYKGGVAKTTTCRTLGQGLALNPDYNLGKPILLIDFDPQGNTARRWDLVEPIPNTIFSMPRPHPDLVRDGETVQRSSVCDLWLNLLDPTADSYHPVPYPTDTTKQLAELGVYSSEVFPIKSDLLHVLPNNEQQLVQMQMHLPDGPMAKRAGELLRDWLRSEEVADQYSYVIIDTPPTKTSIISIALTAATHMFIPFIPEPQSVDGIMSMISYVQTLMGTRRESDDLPLGFLGLLPTIAQPRTTIHQTQLKRIENSPALNKFLLPMIRRGVAFAETDNWQSMPDHVFTSKVDNSSKDARRFVDMAAKKIMADRATWSQIA